MTKIIYHLKVHLIIISYLIELEKDRFELQNHFFLAINNDFS